MAKAVLFDLDGTLVDSREAVVWCVNELLRRLGLPPAAPAEIIPLIGVGLVPLLKTFIDDAERHAAEYRRLYREGFHSRTHMYPGVRETLAVLQSRGLPAAVVTNRNRDLAQLILDHFELGAYFAVVLGQYDGMRLKPDPEMVLKACAAVDVHPVESALVGDTEIDVETGRNAGAFTIKVDYEDLDGPTAADAVVSEFPRLLEFV